ncbi:helix-turn-helix domain-containing protein [Streptomyces sp. G44]|uniref:helix-turn-helix domain-containing protein n=1 Tax=Streptomyces sp. G44 TaxID=2807632 RepID=UPI00195F64B9|nr:helix-turn-helix domain-containing protein [Streptomyces sp. G44]MBM7172112.1 helix-turn-helix domain-containing protein [Streptomyces sp. G44]
MSTGSGTAISSGATASAEVAAALSLWLTPVEEDPAEKAPAGGAVTLHHFGYVDMITCAAGPLALTRGPGPAVAGVPESVALLVPRAGAVRVAQDGRRACAADGELALIDLGRAFSLAWESPSRFLLFRLPLHALHVPVADLRRATGRALTPPDAVDALLTPLLGYLDESAARLPAGVAERLGGVVTDAVADLLGELSEEAASPARSGPRQQVVTIRQYIERHLGDPELSAERIAAAHFISVRYLHRLFEGEGITVSRLIQRRRVEQCARELSRRGRVSPSLGVVAARWGFRSAAHFSRAFKAVHGHPPQQWRRLVLMSEAGGGTAR